MIWRSERYEYWSKDSLNRVNKEEYDNYFFNKWSVDLSDLLIGDLKQHLKYFQIEGYNQLIELYTQKEEIDKILVGIKEDERVKVRLVIMEKLKEMNDDYEDNIDRWISNKSNEWFEKNKVGIGVFMVLVIVVLVYLFM